MAIEDRARQVRVTYRRAVSDGNYGTESAEVSLDWFIEDKEETHEDLDAAQEMLSQARDVVMRQLANSDSITIRKGVSQRTTAPVRTAATVPADDEDPF
jgi:hypothetical protein